MLLDGIAHLGGRSPSAPSSGFGMIAALYELAMRDL